MGRSMGIFRGAAACLATLLVAGTAAGSAQQPPVGTVAFALRVHLPDSLPMPQMAGDTFAIRAQVASDGQRYAVELDPGHISAVPTLAGARMRLVYDPASDSLHGALIMSPAATGGTTGPTGYRIDISLKSLHALQTHLTDTLQHITAPEQTYQDLGTTAVVAGIRCENWRETSPTDTVNLCVTPIPARLQDFITAWQKKMGLDTLVKRMTGGVMPFGGQHVVPLSVDDANGRVHMEVTSVSGAAPDPEMFTMPPGLIPFPLPAFPSDSGGH